MTTRIQEIQPSLQRTLKNLCRDPSAALLGWRSPDPVVVAMLYADCGYPVFPCNIKKKPLTKHGFYDATCDLNQISQWAYESRFPGTWMHQLRGFCVRTGRYDDEFGPPGLWVLDIDGPRGYARLAELEAKLGPLPDTVTTISGRSEGGEHRAFWPPYYGLDMKSRGSAVILGEQGKIDQKGRGGYFVAAASGHVSGKDYRFAVGRAPDEIPFAYLTPQWIDAIEKVDTPGLTVRKPRSKKPAQPKANADYDRHSLILGDGHGNFHDPINRLAIRYFQKAGSNASGEKIKGWLRNQIGAAHKDSGRDVSRYLSDAYLTEAVESARQFVREKKYK